MNNSEIKFFKKLILFIGISVFISFVIEYSIHSNFEQIYELDNSLTDNNAIIYFGDSVIKTSSEYDNDKRSIGEMLEESSQRNVTVISDEAYHLGLFAAFSDYIIHKNYKPEYVIIPINLRSFSQEWDSRPEYQFSDQIKILESDLKPVTFSILYNRIINLLQKDDDSLQHRNWENLPVFLGNSERGVVKDYLTDNDPTLYDEISSKYIFHYLYTINANHRKIVDLKRIIENYKKNNTPIIIYITPIDYQSGNFYYKDFTKIVDLNISVIKKIGDDLGVNIYDLSYSLDTSYFNHPNTPNEHLNEFGRRFIADYLNDIISKK